MDNTFSDLKQYTINQLSEKLNIPKPTLRFWEKEISGVIDPLRTPGGQRRYTDNHIAILKQIKDLRDSGRSISEIKEYFENGHSSDDPEKNEIDIDILSEKIAEIVKTEISRFLKKK